MATYAKWRERTPPDFRFAVKLPRTITHDLKLEDTREPLLAFLAQTDGLAEKRGPLLVQLPPSLSFNAAVVNEFFTLVRTVYDESVVCQPRHETWFSPSAGSLLDRYRISRVVADPPPAPNAGVAAGWPRLAYFRLHGSPRKYWSKYDERDIATLATAARSNLSAEEVWCVFDNTASGAAIENAWELCDVSPLMRRVRKGFHVGQHTPKPMRYDAVLLDIDGTLVDSNGAHAAAWSDAFATYGRHHSPEVIRPLIGKGGDKLLREVASLDDQCGEGKKISEARAEIFKSRYLRHPQANAGAPAFIEWLLQSRLTVVVATSAKTGGGTGAADDLRRSGIGAARDDVGRRGAIQA